MSPTRTRPPQLLIASQNHGPGSELLQLAERRGYNVRRVHSGAQALAQAPAAPPALVGLDESLTGKDAVPPPPPRARAGARRASRSRGARRVAHRHGRVRRDPRAARRRPRGPGHPAPLDLHPTTVVAPTSHRAAGRRLGIPALSV